ncbi:TmeB family type III secretion system effector [Chlamydia suis]|uniref:TmeB family type III secretion system effector n=1 Tax=Chlamydia suis TaxID=83559 RepID=UPI0009E57D31|nr:hypothetical protein [Chlamydia suis]
MNGVSSIGGGSGPEGVSESHRDEQLDQSEAEEGELEERVSDSAESVIADSSETLLRTTSSEGIAENLQQHISVEESPRQRGFLGRIRDAVASIWKHRILRRSGSDHVGKAAEQYGITQILYASKMPSLTTACRHFRAFGSSCLNAIRNFFAKIFHALRDAYAKNCTRSGLNFCGAGKDSLEVLAATGLLLRMATLHSFEKVGGNYEDRLENNDAPVIDEGRTLVDDTEEHIEALLSTRAQWPQNVMLGFSRGLVKLCATPYYANPFSCLKSIADLEKKDPSADYSQALVLASEIDRLAEFAPTAAKYVLDALRFRTSELLGELISLDLLPPRGEESRVGGFPPVNEQLVVQIFHANIDRLYATFLQDQQAYLRMIEGLVQNFFLIPREEDPSSDGTPNNF